MVPKGHLVVDFKKPLDIQAIKEKCSMNSDIIVFVEFTTVI